MGEESSSSVKLHGMWASPFAWRAKLALKVKGIEYEYIEENLSNKSELLLQYNPVHKKVPVFVHNGLPIVESLSILEYIDETWTNPPHLLPKEPYQRAKHRFWAAFFQRVFDLMFKTAMTEGEAQESVVNELLKKLDVVEEGIKKEIYSYGVPNFVEDVKPGYLDIVVYPLFAAQEAAEEFCGVNYLTSERYPLLVSWIDALKKVGHVQDVTPPKDKMLAFLGFLRHKCSQPKP